MTDRSSAAKKKDQLAHLKVKDGPRACRTSSRPGKLTSSTRRTHAEASLGLAFNPRRQRRGERDQYLGQPPFDRLPRAGQEREKKELIISGNWKGNRNSLSRGAGADQA